MRSPAPARSRYALVHAGRDARREPQPATHQLGAGAHQLLVEHVERRARGFVARHRPSGARCAVARRVRSRRARRRSGARTRRGGRRGRRVGAPARPSRARGRRARRSSPAARPRGRACVGSRAGRAARGCGRRCGSRPRRAAPRPPRSSIARRSTARSVPSRTSAASGTPRNDRPVRRPADGLEEAGLALPVGAHDHADAHRELQRARPRSSGSRSPRGA